MALHLLRPERLARRLAAGAVTPAEQAAYVAVSMVVWLVPGYLYIWPQFLWNDDWWIRVLWFGQFGMLVIINAAGVQYCLRQCHHDAARNFLVDFSCLYAPASILAIGLSWAIFHLAFGLFRLALAGGLDVAPSLWTRFHDLGVYLVVAGQLAAVYFVVGQRMRLAADLRAAATP